MNKSANRSPMRKWQIRIIEESIADIKTALSVLEFAQRNHKQPQFGLIWDSERFLEVSISKLNQLKPRSNVDRSSQ